MLETCPYCREAIAGQNVIRCPSCATPHHKDCFAENGGCTVFGCESAPQDAPKISVTSLDIPTSTPPPPFPIESQPIRTLYFVHRSGEQFGPYSLRELQQFVAEKRVATTDFAWSEGMPEWAFVSDVVGNWEHSSTPAGPLLPVATSVGHRVEESSSSGPTGIGGWLLFFCISLTILRPLWGAVQLNDNWTKSQAAFTRFPAAETAVLLENWGSACILVYGFIVGCLIWNGVPYGKRIAQQFLVISFIALAAVEIITLGVMNDLPRVALDAATAAVMPELSKSALGSLIWWFYFKRSTRVKNTYG